MTVKLNLGCGKNALDGWENHDADVDISKPLPWHASAADFIFCEHCVEHVTYYQAIEFFKECHRVLCPGGVVRIAVPSLEQIMQWGDQDYFQFTTQFHKQGATVRGAMHSILYQFGHKTAWTDSLLESTLFFSGFDSLSIAKRAPNESPHTALRGIDGHAKIISARWNVIETIVWEGIK